MCIKSLFIQQRRYTLDHPSDLLLVVIIFSVGLQLVFNTEQGLPIAADWLFFNRINVRARQGLRLGPVRCIARLVYYQDFSFSMHLTPISTVLSPFRRITFCESIMWLMGGKCFVFTN